MKAQIYHLGYWCHITDPEFYQHTMRDMLQQAGFGVCDFSEKHFEPHGYTCVYILEESHLAVHTFPEEHTAYIELSSCIQEPFDRFMQIFLAYQDRGSQ